MDKTLRGPKVILRRLIICDKVCKNRKPDIILSTGDAWGNAMGEARPGDSFISRGSDEEVGRPLTNDHELMYPTIIESLESSPFLDVSSA
jgi:hypothetical protein